jgi:hypothetical protein
MNRKQTKILFCLISVFVLAVLFLTGCRSKAPDGLIIFTRISGKTADKNSDTGTIPQSSIVSLNTKKSGSQPEVLTNGFYSARSPQISSDGIRMIFSAQQKKDETWQIWEMDLGKMKSRKISDLADNCTDPAYLPNGRVIFSKRSANNKTADGTSIVSCKSDGSDLKQVTFNPFLYSCITVLKDGRVLVVNRKPDNQNSESVLMVMRPDGTKNELFYAGREGSRLNSRGWETGDGKILFVESPAGESDGGDLISVSYNRPLNSRKILAAGTGGKFVSVYPLMSGKCLVSYRKSGSDKVGLYLLSPTDQTPGTALFETTESGIDDVIAVEIRDRARKLPSEVDLGVKTGLLLCQDVNFSGLTAQNGRSGAVINKIRIIGRDSVLGDVDVEKDGSFYLKVKADTPFRIQKLDAGGNPVGQPCTWIYLRPNERRGCVGCHEDQEIVPDNKVSLAVKHAPVGIPVHITKVVEKKVSLE